MSEINMRDIGERLADRLCDIQEEFFKADADMQLSLIAHSPGNEDCFIILTREPIEKLIEVLKRKVSQSYFNL